MTRAKRATVALVLGTISVTACTAKTLSPPLSGATAHDRKFGGVYLTSGALKRPHRVIGVVQMTQSGYKWLHEVELVDDARPESLLFRIGDYARSLGADGVQHLQLIDLDPQTPADNANRKINSVIRMEKAIERKQYASIAGEGTKTYWEIRGELIQFVNRPPGEL
jgi:hypothetical protein